MKKLVRLFRQFIRDVSVEHYGNGFRGGADEAERLMDVEHNEDQRAPPRLRHA